ncbi:PfkB family carbohydrate kinase [Brachybacterium sp. GCM10030252]|uniref:PfkB family carbohydrate kinase n=1 Tax=Brachybacterium sp. GCM10030252 TaxID=3273380 RepID=UPI0036065877
MVHSHGAHSDPAHATTAGGVLVVGQIGRDLVLSADRVPEPGASVDVSERLEMWGGKGANQAVGMRQLGTPVGLLGVVGEDEVGERLLASARADDIDVRAVVRRGTSVLLVDVVDAEGRRRLFEHVPAEALLTGGDVYSAREAVARADTVCLQLQQPEPALLEAARLATATGADLVLDGAPQTPEVRALVGQARVVRANAHEGELLTGFALDTEEAALSAARGVLEEGVEVVAFGVADAGDLVVWAEGHRFLPHGTQRVLDPTGAGDAFLAGLVTGLRNGAAPARAGELAADCAASTVQRLGGRPDLSALRP